MTATEPIMKAGDVKYVRFSAPRSRPHGGVRHRLRPGRRAPWRQRALLPRPRGFAVSPRGPPRPGQVPRARVRGRPRRRPPQARRRDRGMLTGPRHRRHRGRARRRQAGALGRSDHRLRVRGRPRSDRRRDGAAARPDRVQPRRSLRTSRRPPGHRRQPPPQPGRSRPAGDPPPRPCRPVHPGRGPIRR